MKLLDNNTLIGISNNPTKYIRAFTKKYIFMNLFFHNNNNNDNNNNNSNNDNNNNIKKKKKEKKKKNIFLIYLK